MSPNNYKQLFIGGIILGSTIFFSNHLISHAEELPEKTDETLNIIIPSPILLEQEQGRQQESRSSIIQGEMIQQQNYEEKGIEILEQQEDKGQEIQEELEEDDTRITRITSITTSNIIEEKQEEEEEEQDNN